MRYVVEEGNLTQLELRVWNMLKERYGNDNAITAKDFEKSLGISRFHLCGIIQNLRLKHGVPIVSNKRSSLKKGYYLPVKLSDFNTTMVDFQVQADKMQSAVKVLEKARRELLYAQAGLQRMDSLAQAT